MEILSLSVEAVKSFNVYPGQFFKWACEWLVVAVEVEVLTA